MKTLCMFCVAIAFMFAGMVLALVAEIAKISNPQALCSLAFALLAIFFGSMLLRYVGDL